MKITKGYITKGYTLSQFIDWLNEDKRKGAFGQITNHVDINVFHDKVTWYNDWLKQPLKKEMFVNPLSKPQAWTLYNMQAFECTADEMRLCREYKEAEKKVIFEGFNVAHEGGICEFIYWNMYRIYFNKDGIHTVDIGYYGRVNNIITIHDLFEATKSELKLKNVEI